MLVLCCTKKLLARTGPPVEALAPSTTRLGDWYANLLYSRQGQLILCVSERTLLPVLVPARDARSLPRRLAHEVGEMLAWLGIPLALIESELNEMVTVQIARTANRQVLGSMNDLAFMAQLDLDEGTSPRAAAQRLADAPCSPLGMLDPIRATRALMANAIQ